MRQEHKFQFTGRAIAEAAKAEYEFHVKRAKWWEGEQETAIKVAKESEVGVREVPITGGKRVEVFLAVEPYVLARLNECGLKIIYHRQAADRFKVEAAAYETQWERSYELSPDDVFYFRLAGGERQE